MIYDYIDKLIQLNQVICSSIYCIWILFFIFKVQSWIRCSVFISELIFQTKLFQNWYFRQDEFQLEWFLVCFSIIVALLRHKKHFCNKKYFSIKNTTTIIIQIYFRYESNEEAEIEMPWKSCFRIQICLLQSIVGEVGIEMIQKYSFWIQIDFQWTLVDEAEMAMLWIFSLPWLIYRHHVPRKSTFIIIDLRNLKSLFHYLGWYASYLDKHTRELSLLTEVGWSLFGIFGGTKACVNSLYIANKINR